MNDDPQAEQARPNPWQKAVLERLKKAGIDPVPNDPELALQMFAMALARAQRETESGKKFDSINKNPADNHIFGGIMVINSPDDVHFTGCCAEPPPGINPNPEMEGQPIPALILQHSIGGERKTMMLLFNNSRSVIEFTRAVNKMMLAKMFPKECNDRDFKG